ncbi:MAG: bifunctional diaminohydroxyphosphoribosylaminopyrimidine deaminase/5-amino-6-(5-phosphoribosylamino)uracil reductase RibD [Candidatus Muiribacteriaceae bacterium]
MDENHEKYIRKCFRLALRGYGKVSPNPLVGSVIVKNGDIISEGYHSFFGGLHAERSAILNSRKSPEGATIYVNLEPCSHHGKTPPCTDIIINSGIKRVVFSNRDPNREAGAGTANILRKHGIEVISGILEKEGRYVNRAFFTNICSKRPYVFLKWGQTLDGKISDYTVKNVSITSSIARRDTHRLRFGADAILVGINTVLSDNPSLTVRYGREKILKKVVLDTDGIIPERSRLVQESPQQLVIFTYYMSEDKEEELVQKGVSIYRVHPGDIPSVLETLWFKEDVGILMVEGGARIHGSFLESGLASEAFVYLASNILGDPYAKSAIDRGRTYSMKDSVRMKIHQIKRIGPDLRLKYDIKAGIRN